MMQFSKQDGQQGSHVLATCVVHTDLSPFSITSEGRLFFLN